MKTVTYNGYQASVEFDDGTLFVKVLHINDLLVAECDKASEVEATARALIDDYIQTCAELGRNPEPPFKGSFNIRMTPELHKKVAIAAAEEGKSLNAWVGAAVAEKLDCGRLEDRFDGVISRKDSTASILRTIQTMHAQNNVRGAYRHAKIAEGIHVDNMPFPDALIMVDSVERRWGKLNA